MSVAGVGVYGPPRFMTKEVERAATAASEATSKSAAKPAIVALQTPNDAVAQAWADLQAIPLFSRLFTRYVWIQEGQPVPLKQSMRTTSLTLNYVSRASSIRMPPPVAASSGHLIRVDLRMYAPRDVDIRDWLKEWEELRFDPMFALLLTKDTLEFADKAVVEALGVESRRLPRKKVARTITRKATVPGGWREETRTIQHPGGPFTWPDDTGRHHDDLRPGLFEVDLRFRLPDTEKEIAETIEEEVPLALANIGANGAADVVRLNPAHIDPGAYAKLQLFTGSEAPVVDHRYLKARALTAIRDKGVFKTIFGGLYYQFRGVKKAKDVLGRDTKATDLDLFFQNLGVGNIKAGETADQLFERLRSDQRAFLLRSGVTGKPREGDVLPTEAEREGSSRGAITGDVKDEDVDLGERSFAVLLKPVRRAREAIFPGLNSMPITALFNEQGALQDEVPPDVAVDTTIPSPHTKRLQPIISCLRCHAADGSDWWKPLPNDVKTLLGRRQLDLFGDLSQGRNAFSSDIIDRLLGLAAGDFTKHLRRARDDAAEATLRATGPWEGGEDQAGIVKLANQRLADEYQAYVYDLVTPQTALRELGLEVSDRVKAVEIFRELVPPDLRSTVELLPGAAYVPEDPRVGALRAGLSINRSDWALVYAFVADRVKVKLSTFPKAGKQ